MTNGGEGVYEELKVLIEAENNNELECRKYLRHVRDLLVDVTAASYIDEVEEYRGHSGDSDYLIVCKATDGGGIESNKGYIWEVKAPQCYLFEFDTQNRVRPTRDFISAENQLLHYWEESKGSTTFLAEFKIPHPNDLKLGGVIIGSKKTWVRGGNYEQKKMERLYRTALNLRTNHLYGHSGIQVMIWDHILDFLKPNEEPTKKMAEFDQPLKIPKQEYPVVSSDS